MTIGLNTKWGQIFILGARLASGFDCPKLRCRSRVSLVGAYYAQFLFLIAAASNSLFRVCFFSSGFVHFCEKTSGGSHVKSTNRTAVKILRKTRKGGHFPTPRAHNVSCIPGNCLQNVSCSVYLWAIDHVK